MAPEHRPEYRHHARPGDALSAVPSPPPASGAPLGALPVIERRILPNGIVLLGSERLEARSVVLRARLRAGALYDTAETEGLARLVAVMLQHGTGRYSFAALNELTDSLGASIGVEAGRVFVDLAVRCLVEDFPRMTGLLAEVLRRPTFPADELEKVRGQTIAAIVREEQDTRAVAERGLRQLAFPPEHPYARSVLGERETVRAIDRDALAAFHARHYRPDLLTLAAVGGVGLAAALAAIEPEFGDWRAAGETPPRAIPDAPPPATTRRREFPLAGKTQSDVALGLPTLSRTDPDYYALDTANLILGRLGLYGRLGQTVRQEQGLAYYAYSALDAGLGPGAWSARAGVNPVNVERAIASIVAEVARLRDEPVGAPELADARDFLTGSLPLALESPDGTARALLTIETYDLGLDYFARYPAIIAALTPEQLQAAARRYLHPERMAIAIAGPEREGVKREA